MVDAEKTYRNNSGELITLSSQIKLEKASKYAVRSAVTD